MRVGDGESSDIGTLPDTPHDTDVEVEVQSPKSAMQLEDSTGTPASGLGLFFGNGL